jgi:hypothetical protein
VPLALLGGYRAAARLQRGLARRYLALRIHQPAPHDTAGRVVAHALLSLPLNLVSLVLTAYLWSLVPVNIAYPLRPGVTSPDSYHHAWGGPTLVGVWAVHAAGGVGVPVRDPCIVKAITSLQGPARATPAGHRRMRRRS